MKLFSPITCLSLCVVSVTARATITMSPSDYYASTSDGIGNDDASTHLNTTIAIPFLHTNVNAVDGSSYSNNTVDWNVIDGQTILSLGMVHQRSGTSQSHAGSDQGFLNFAANSNEPYEWSGNYNITDVEECGTLVMQAYLYDATARSYVFFTSQGSVSTPNEQLTLGEAGGDDYNELRGSLTGNLIAGHAYSASIFAYTQAYPDADSGAYAVGNIALKIGVVPEPSTLALLGIGAIGLLGYRKAKSHGSSADSHRNSTFDHFD